MTVPLDTSWNWQGEWNADLWTTWKFKIAILAVELSMCLTILQWYYVAVGFMLVPFMGVANSYGAGLTDQDNSSMYGKLCIFIFAAWAGTKSGGVIAGLGMCGVILASTSQAANLMQASTPLFSPPLPPFPHPRN